MVIFYMIIEYNNAKRYKKLSPFLEYDKEKENEKNGKKAREACD